MRAGLHGAHGRGDVGERRHHQDLHRVACGLHALEELRPRHARHADVDEDHVERRALEHVERREPVLRRLGDDASLAEDPRERAAQCVLVVDDERAHGFLAVVAKRVGTVVARGCRRQLRH